MVRCRSDAKQANAKSLPPSARITCIYLFAQDDDSWPSLSYLRSDYKAVSVVAHIRIQKAEITSRIVGYENWTIRAEVIESFKGRFKKGNVIEYVHGAEAGFKREYFMVQGGNDLRRSAKLFFINEIRTTDCHPMICESSRSYF